MTTLDLLQEVTFGRINMRSGAFGYGYRCMDHSSYSNQWKTRQVYFFFTLQYRQLTPTPDFFMQQNKQNPLPPVGRHHATLS